MATLAHTIGTVRLRHNLHLLGGRRVYKTVFPVIPSTMLGSGHAYSCRVTIGIDMKYALIILRHGSVPTHPRFRETFSGPAGSLIAHNLSITLPAPSQTHVSLYSEDLRSNRHK